MILQVKICWPKSVGTWGSGIMKKLISSLALSAACVVGATLAACATPIVTFTDVGTLPGTAASTTVDGGTFSTTPEIVSGSSSGHYRSPFSDSTAYFAIGTLDGTGSVSSPISLTFSGLKDTFNILWGSPDTYNQLQFYNGNTEVAVLTPGQGGFLPATSNGAYGVKLYNLLYDKVVFVDNYSGTTSTGPDTPAFEFANVSTVPIPATGFLLLAAIGGFAALRRRKQA